MKYFTNLVAGILLVCSMMAPLSAQNLYVLENNGQQTSFLINEISKLYFSSGELIVDMTEGASENYTLSGIRYLNFSDLVGISEKPGEEGPDARLYPNPVTGTLHIEFYLPEEAMASLEIISMDGRQLHAESLVEAGGVNHWQADVSAFPAGVYLCRFYSDKFLITRKIIKK
jgi:hypothetical protein